MRYNNIILLFVAVLAVISSCAPPYPKNNKSGNPSSIRTGRPSLPYQEQETKIESGNRERNVRGMKRMSGQEIFRHCSPAVFMIYTSNDSEGFQGSGFFITEDGLAVSNYHVFKGTFKGYEKIHLADGREFKISEVVVCDENNDIIVFRLASNGMKFHYLPLSTHSIQVGDKVYAISSPLGLENTFSSGEISAVRGSSLIQISVPITHGSSGGALINEFGEAIGVTSSGFEEGNLNFAINIEIVRKYLR